MEERECRYIIKEGNREIATFECIKDALIFIEASDEKYDLDPCWHYEIKREIIKNPMDI